MRLFNLVGTRAAHGERGGEHDALLRWYVDHVHQLFGFDGLLEATLYGAADLSAVASDAPEYLCLYEFADADAFDAYETGALRAAVARDRERGWGRDGIRITWRAAYRPRYRREGAAAATRWRVEAWSRAAGGDPGADGVDDALVERELAARAGPLASLGLLRARERPCTAGDWLTLCAPAPADVAPPRGLERAWRGDYDVLLRWRR